MADATLYLFDGHNLLHAGGFRDARELVDALASYVALRGASGILVFDGHGEDERHGALQVRFARDADAAIERLAAEHRERERVCVVSSDTAVRETTGPLVGKIGSPAFLAALEAPEHSEHRRRELADQLDPKTRARLDRLRRER